MADKHSKSPGNAAGRYYVDNSCLACSLCEQEAPTIFRYIPAIGATVVFKQPTTQAEIDQIQVATECCCVDAIGSDGDPLPPWAVS